MRKRGLRAEAIHLEFCSRLKKRARKQNTAIEKVADEAGISHSQIWRILAGQSSPSLETIAAIAEALGCRPRDLLP